MSRAITYYDWVLPHKRSEGKLPKSLEDINNSGVPVMSFKEFLEEWKEKNHID